ncbi:MAG: RAD55 family ATPase [Candidatus Caldatribacteriaceae bacterium]
MRVRTGIEGLDDLVLDGGIPVYSVNIVAGPPGSGKTIFVQNLVFNSVSQGLRAVYLTTLSEPRFKMVRNLQEFAFLMGHCLGKG